MLKTWNILCVIIFLESKALSGAYIIPTVPVYKPPPPPITERIQLQCVQETALSGSISNSLIILSQSSEKKCWKVQVPINNFIRLKLIELDYYTKDCAYVSVQISVERSGESYVFCPSDTNWNTVIAHSEVKITFHLKNIDSGNRIGKFLLNYEIKHFDCIKADSFQCTNHTCVQLTEVCDGIKDCENGADELSCNTLITAVGGVDESRKRAIDWLKSKRTATWGWSENTARAVTALFLGAGANFKKSLPEEELMAKQVELKAAVALLRTMIPEDLSMLINALLVTCHSPFCFYGNNLVKILKEQLQSSDNITHPIAYLALCNANETWPDRAITDLNAILNSDSNYPFIRDIQAFAVMALSCMANGAELFHKFENTSLETHYEKIVKQFKQFQTSDGSFGNVHTTALITQALFSSGQENARDWDLNASLKYLMKELNSTNVDLITICLTLPILNGKSLSDISEVNCSVNPRNHGDGHLVLEMNEYLGTKIQVLYSLFVGDKKDVIYTISLRVPENFTAFEVMQLAEIEDPRYKFEWKIISRQMYVYKIGKIINDPETGKFWLMYTGSSNDTKKFVHSPLDPDKLFLSDHDHLVMWYKRAYF